MRLGEIIVRPQSGSLDRLLHGVTRGPGDLELNGALSAVSSSGFLAAGVVRR